jgi:CheY-like chemotaxis protein
MNMNIYAHKPGPLSKAFLQVVGLTNDKLVEVADQKSADIVLLTGSDELRALYNDKQLFCVLMTGQRDISKNQPENVCLLNTIRLLDSNDGVIKLLELIEKRKTAKQVEKPEAQKPSNIVGCTKRYSVLVIDDTEENLRTAETVLAGHLVVTTSRLEQAVKLMEGQRFDAVLTDMEMPPDKLYSALNLDHYGMKETVPYGFAAIIEVTERGIPVAVVTDGNHHAGWVSAMFDHKRGATVNGQKVLFFNGIGKRWDKALKHLMEE